MGSPKKYWAVEKHSISQLFPITDEETEAQKASVTSLKSQS